MRLAVLLAFIALASACAPTSNTPAAPTDATHALMSWSELLARPRPAATHSIRFGGAATDIADLWLPDGAGPFPVVLMVHGGCWQKAIADRTLMNYAAEDLRGRGIAVWNIEYRGVDEEGGGYPGTFQDVARAADALRDAAARYPLNLDRVVAFGHSAGGHLALWLAARPRLPASSALRSDDPLPISAVLNVGGLADLRASAPVTPASCLASILDQLTGAPGARRPDVFADTSPAEMLPLGARVVSVNGDRDPIAPPALGLALISRAREAGNAADFLLIANTGHVELIAPGTAAFGAETEAIQNLLR